MKLVFADAAWADYCHWQTHDAALFARINDLIGAIQRDPRSGIGEPEALRGPQHSHAWCDEIAKWDSARAQSAWDNLLLGLRLGERAQAVATTTPRAVPLMRRLLAEQAAGTTVMAGGATQDNAAHLPGAFLDDMDRQFGGTTLGRQEIGGVLIDDVEGALWTRSMLENCRDTMMGDPPLRVVIGVDPPASAHGDACGIVAAGRRDRTGYVLADRSARGLSPAGWARRVAGGTGSSLPGSGAAAGSGRPGGGLWGAGGGGLPCGSVIAVNSNCR